MHTLFRNSAARGDGFRDADAVMLCGHLMDAKLVDVRDPDELTVDLGHIAGVTNVPLSTCTRYSAVKAGLTASSRYA